MAKPKKVKTRTGRSIELDGDLIPILDALYEDVAVASGFEHDYLQMRAEFEHIAKQLSPKELRDYFVNAAFLNFVSYENEMAARILENIARTKAAQKGLKKTTRRSGARTR